MAVQAGDRRPGRELGGTISYLDLFHALVLGVVEGLTEFLPVSSTGHLIIVGDAIGFTGERAAVFEIFIQLGAILGVVWHFRARVLDLALHATRPAERDFLAKLFVAFFPAAALGFFAHDYITTRLFNPVTVAWALIVGGFVILAIEAWYQRQQPSVLEVDRISYGDALKVGVAQTFALFPGVSRAGATIMGGLLGGLSRQTATEFSFFLAMPTMLAATSYDLLKRFDVLEPGDALVFAVGFVTAFVTAVVVVRVFLGFVARYTFKVFAWYRIAFGALVLLYFSLRS